MFSLVGKVEKNGTIVRSHPQNGEFKIDGELQRWIKDGDWIAFDYEIIEDDYSVEKEVVMLSTQTSDIEKTLDKNIKNFETLAQGLRDVKEQVQNDKGTHQKES